MSAERVQAQVSPITNARAWAIKKVSGAGIGFQLDLAHAQWVKTNYPEIFETVTVENTPVDEPAPKKKRK